MGQQKYIAGENADNIFAKLLEAWFLFLKTSRYVDQFTETMWLYLQFPLKSILSAQL